MNSHRYSFAKECPFGDFFLNYIENTYNIYVSRKPVTSNIETYTENTAHPESPNNSLRDGIALHCGGSDAAIGCLTFNKKYGADGIYTEFENKIYPTDRRNNDKMLNFICIDERNAIGLDPDNATCSIDRGVYESTEVIKKGTVVPFWRYYDLIKPVDELKNTKI